MTGNMGNAFPFPGTGLPDSLIVGIANCLHTFAGITLLGYAREGVRL